MRVGPITASEPITSLPACGGRADQHEILHRGQGLIEADDHADRFLLHVEVGAEQLDDFFFLLQGLAAFPAAAGGPARR